MHPNVQDRLYEEIRATVTNDDDIDYDTLSKLEYMDRVIKETMRILAVIHFVARVAETDVQLTECIVPKGTVMLLSLQKMHSDEKIWGPTAHEFDPDRFLPEFEAHRHPFAFIPFSAGQRNCIGWKYALLTLKVALCHLLLKYKFSTSMKLGDIVFKSELFLKLENEYMLKLERRYD